MLKAPSAAFAEGAFKKADSLAVLFRRAHQANDKAVMLSDGLWGKLNTETECIAELMKMYRELTEKR